MDDLRQRYAAVARNLDTHSARFTMTELETVARYLELLEPSPQSAEQPEVAPE